jgi:hypothetical protein
VSSDNLGALRPKPPVAQIAGHDPLRGKDFVVHIPAKPRSAATAALVVEGRLELPSPSTVPTLGWRDLLPYWNPRLMRAVADLLSHRGQR